MNAVDEEIRRNFESDWLRGQCGDIVDYLPTPDAPSYLPTLEELICIDLEFRWQRLSTHSVGIDSATETLTLDQQPLVEKYLDRFPQLHEPSILQRLVDQEIYARKDSPFPPQQAEYQQRFPQLQLLPSSFPNANGPPADETRQYSTLRPSSAGETFPSAFGPYELVELLGRGGMGKVYRAHQAKADRMVAIKIAGFSGAPPEIRDEIAIRFESEVRAAANLSHDNVMPIYDVGEADGSLYYTMPIVAGDLASEVRKNPLSNKVAARYIAQASRGVAAAHAQGLLHRDLKPHNLMLDPQNDRVLVADFGLARLMSAEQQLTLTGEVLGTPTYMAPEQIRSSHAIDVRADVYALGATLYHLLVGKPPIQAATPAETLRQVLEEEAVSPRDLNPQVDRDLETICLRCLQKDPRSRFPSADELADDLERYLRGEPIKSRPIGMWGRLDRWRRRNPKVAALSAGLAASLLLVAIIAGLGWYSTQLQLSRVMQNNRQGQLAVNELFTFIRDEPLLEQPGQEAVRAELLKRGLEHYQMLIALAHENEVLPADLQEARTQLGLLHLETHEPAEAAALFRKAIAEGEKLPKEVAETRQVRTSLSDSWNGLGQTLHREGKDAEAMAAFEKAIALREAVVKEAPQEMEPRRKLANARMNRALILAAQGKKEESQTAQVVAQRARHQLLRDNDNDPKLLRDFAQGQFNLARLELSQGASPKAFELLQDATHRFQDLSHRYSTDARLWQRYVECLLTMSLLEDHPSPSLQKAADLLPSAMMLAPDNRTYRIRLIEISQQAIGMLLENRNYLAADTNWRKVHEDLIRPLGDEDQSVEAMRIRLVSLRQHGLITLGLGDKGLAKRQLRAAIQVNNNTKENPAYAAIWTQQWRDEWDAIEQLADSLD
ncbi:protein kinase [Blastopirellula sp. JC732]|uniref:Protein kinase n=1 Tax=Blastopirellula sediminis TaxID=2894196 RepID=A0A9X1MPM3_9BACT|nr:serine/threonine-protein kinase [Blastopirellula sediminis]MCC9606095.1 protein kinase [Blastopirellula sediminis]MCC9630606.1 protein kinase [Blastopirellula sediminis]